MKGILERNFGGIVVHEVADGRVEQMMLANVFLFKYPVTLSGKSLIPFTWSRLRCDYFQLDDNSRIHSLLNNESKKGIHRDTEIVVDEFLKRFVDNRALQVNLTINIGPMYSHSFGVIMNQS